MVVLRATRKVLRALPVSGSDCSKSDTALGDWYVNRLVVDRQPLLLLVSSESLLTLVIPARSVRTLPNRLSALVDARLRRLGVADDLIHAEVAAMDRVCVRPTASRSVVGSMVDFAKSIPYHLSADGWDMTALPLVEEKLAHIPCRVMGRFEDTIWPDRKTCELLTEAWNGQPSRSGVGAGVDSSARGGSQRMHVPFLERASGEKDLDLLGFGALLVVRAVDGILVGQTDGTAFTNQIEGLHSYLNDLPPVQEVWFLRAIVRACEHHVRVQAGRREVVETLRSYSSWLRTENRSAEAADVDLLVTEWNAV